MGQYEPDDSRDVTLKPGHEPGGLERTGPRESETRKRDDAGESRPATQSEAQMGYGNARDADDRMERDRRADADRRPGRD